jgi:hypothetical protein
VGLRNLAGIRGKGRGYTDSMDAIQCSTNERVVLQCVQLSYNVCDMPRSLRAIPLPSTLPRAVSRSGRDPRHSQQYLFPAPAGPAPWACAGALVAYPPVLPASWWGPTSKGTSWIGVGLDRPVSRNPGRMRSDSPGVGVPSPIRTVGGLDTGGERGGRGGRLMNHNTKYPHRSLQTRSWGSVSPGVFSEGVGVPVRNTETLF